MKYPSKVLVNNGDELTFSKNELERFNLTKYGKDQYHLLDNHRSQIAQIIKSDFLNRTCTVRINSNFYEVKILRDVDITIQKMGYSNGSAKDVRSVEAPMPGMIIGIQVKAGQQVKQGEVLLVLEAMKMENTILCPKDAVVKNIHVSVGETVDKNKLLIDFE